MYNLTQRQIQILKSLIEEYIQTAMPVGSETLEKKHSLTASPATIRNEMMKLEELGYLKKPHTSAGRIPTPMAMRFYVNQQLKEKELTVAEEVAMKERVWDYREEENRFFRMAVKALAEKTKTLAIAVTEDGDVFTSGYANLLEMPEFFEIDVARELLVALDEYDMLSTLFATKQDGDICILLGEEMGPRLSGPYSCVFTHFTTPMQTRGEIGVIGPTRLNYMYVIPTVRYFGNLVEQVAKGW